MNHSYSISIYLNMIYNLKNRNHTVTAPRRTYDDSYSRICCNSNSNCEMRMYIELLNIYKIEHEKIGFLILILKLNNNEN